MSAEATLKDICIPNGIQTGPFGSQLHAADYVDDPYAVPVVMPKDIANGKIIDETIARITEDMAQSLSRHRLIVGDIVFGRRGDIGRCALVTELQQGWLCGTGCLRARLDEAVAFPPYVIQYLLYDNARDWLNSNAVGQTMLNLSASILSELPVSLPPLPEQRAIAAILNTWDDAIALTSRLIDALKRRKQGLMQCLLTGQTRFPEFAGEEWETIPLGKLFIERRETGFIDLPLVSVTGNGIVYRDSLERRDSSNEDKSKYLRICRGDIGYNTMRMWQGVSGVSSIEGIVSPAYTILKPQDGVNVDFMGYLLKLPETIRIFRRHSQGLVDDTLSLKFDHFARISVTVPHYREQVRIAEVLQTADLEIAGIGKSLETLQTQKRALMQRLLTG